MKRMIVVGFVAGVLLLSGCLPFVPGPPGGGVGEPDVIVTAIIGWSQAGNVSRTIHFDGSGSSTTSGEIAFYEWTPGDGSATVVMTVPEFAHVYPRWRTYTATLVVTDTRGRSAQITVEVTVEPLQPVARFSWTPAGEFVMSFDAIGTPEEPESTADWRLGEEGIVSARWWFGDGTGVEGPWADVGQCLHKYTNFGTYTVTLTITDQHGQTATRTRRVTVP